jgi:NAD(P)-dependent dehydrogenase (short-subunit alcohol dehydrogenase family)
MQAKRSPFTAPSHAALQGLFLITEDRLSCANWVAAALEQKGAKTAILKAATLLEPDRLATEIAQLRQQQGSVAGIVHLAALAPDSWPETLEQWRQATAAHAKSLFHLLKICGEDLQQAGAQQGAFVLSASLLGGYFGRQGAQDTGLPTGGAGVGLLKTLITEWSGVQAKAVDFDSHLSAEAIAQYVVSELLAGGRLEVGYPQGQRTLFETVPTPLSPQTSPQLAPQSDWVVLVTGGARGITAQMAADLVVPGLTLVVTGRSALPAEESPETVGIEEVSALRKILLQQALQQGSRPTPVQIEAQLRQLQGDRDIRQNLERFRQAGAKLEYSSVDVRDEASFGKLIEGIYQRYGRIDAVIHGAGIIEDKLIADKTIDSFTRVFDTKADSAYVLARHLRPDSLKLLVLFSSVAGRYGNRGQSDYAATNEVINRLAWQLDAQWTNTRVIAFNWGPWDTAGMASEGVKRQFRERGIIPIPLEAGRQFFLAELFYGQKGDVEIIAGEGPWEAYEAEQAHHNLVGNRQRATGNTESAPFLLLPSEPELQPNGSVILEHVLSVESDPYLSDHRLDGKPVLPAAGALEWMAELVQVSWPDWQVVGVRDLRVLRGLVLETDAGRPILLRARASTHADSASLDVTVEILDPVQKRPFYQAMVMLQPELSPSPQVETLLATPLSTGVAIAPQEAYQNHLFHGQCFQLITAIDRLNEQGIDARVNPSPLPQWLSPQRLGTASAHWLFDPGVIDTAPQLAIVWARVQHNTTALPSRFGAVTRYRCASAATPLQVAFRVSHVDENSLTYDALFFDASGNVHFHLKAIEGTCNAHLNRLAAQS